MTLRRLLLRNLFYHWRGNLAVLLGVVVGTAVLTGALLVGDSLRGSLRDLTNQRLYWVDQALVGGRFFRQELADRLPAERASPVILLQGTATVRGPGVSGVDARTGRVTVLGVDERFWLTGEAPAGGWNSHRPDCVVNATLARALDARRGARLTLHLDRVTARPHESWRLGDREPGASGHDLQELTVQAEIGDDSPGGRFSLNPSPETPRNLFVPLAWLQEQLSQEKMNLKGRVNALLVGGPGENLESALQKVLRLDDWDLVLYDPQRRTDALFARLAGREDGRRLRRARYLQRVSERFVQQADKNGDRILTRDEVLAYYRTRHNYLSLQSRQTILDPAVAEAARHAAHQTHLRTAPTIVYLANNIAAGRHQATSIAAALMPGMSPVVRSGVLSRGPLQVAYSIAAALDPDQPPALGPFLPRGEKPLGDDEIVLIDWNGWKKADVPTRRGTPITMTFFKADEQRRLREVSAEFRLRSVIPLDRYPAADDPDLTPDFPGITDQLDLANWENPPFPYDRRRVRSQDEQFWRTYRTTPKAYVTLAAGQKMWGSRFGQLTSIRMARDDGRVLTPQDTAAFEARLIPQLADKTGMRFQPVRRRSLEASSGSTDFGMLFLGFSAFLIVSALLLVGLLFRLNLDRRAGEIGLLLAAGYRRRTVRWLLLGEGALLAVAGGALGLAVAAVYAGFLIELFRWLWPSGLNLSFLRLHVTAASVLIGYGAAVLVSVLTIAWAVRVLGKVSPRALLAGETTGAAEVEGQRRPVRWSRWILVVSLASALLLLVLGGFVRDHEMQAMTFFGGGALLLTAGLAGVWAWMRGSRHRPVSPGGWAVARLGVRNAARHPVRSLLTAGLLASATFLVVAVQSFQRDLGSDFHERGGASGGFRLLAESSRPVFAEDLAAATNKLPGATIYPFRLRAGDDASCLNLYQPGRPRLLGVPLALINRGGFKFADSEAGTPEEKANPWLLLSKPEVDGAVPVIGDANSVQWILKSKLGGVIEVPNDRGKMTRLRVVGLLQDSVFQSELLVGETNFFKLYPRQEGYHFFLIDAPATETKSATEILQRALAERGFEVSSTGQRVEEYLAIENTYLRTFQVLGGFGLLLGALGLAVVLVRSVWERRGELALLRALGYRRSALSWLVLAENGFLLALGLAVGTVAALASVAPYLVGRPGALPWLELAELLALVAAVGLAAGAVAAGATLRAPLVPALRRE
jgi:ABC-type antimicrobial peptide transport system permease subunit